MEENKENPNPGDVQEEEVETPDQAEEGTEGEKDGQGEEGEVDYKTKFSESSREAQRLLEENKSFKAKVEELESKSTKLEAEKAELAKALENDNPDKAEIARLQKSVRELGESVALQKEDGEISKFVKDNADAGKVQDSLRRLYRLNPNKSVQEIWDENFKPLAGSGSKEADKKVQKKNQPESGKGSTSGDPDASLDISSDAFRKLPIAKRKEILKKKGF